MTTQDTHCVCGHDLGQHPPDPEKPFAWPCRACDCSEYREETFLSSDLPKKTYKLTITASDGLHPTPQELFEAIFATIENKKNNTETGERIPGSYGVNLDVV